MFVRQATFNTTSSTKINQSRSVKEPIPVQLKLFRALFIYMAI